MEFKPTKAYVGTTTVVGCKSGFYPKNSFEASQVKFECIGERVYSDEDNSFIYIPYFKSMLDVPPLECKSKFWNNANVCLYMEIFHDMNRRKYWSNLCHLKFTSFM